MDTVHRDFNTVDGRSTEVHRVLPSQVQIKTLRGCILYNVYTSVYNFPHPLSVCLSVCRIILYSFLSHLFERLLLPSFSGYVYVYGQLFLPPPQTKCTVITFKMSSFNCHFSLCFLNFFFSLLLLHVHVALADFFLIL